MEKESPAGDGGGGEFVKLQIKFGGQTIPLTLSPDSTVAHLKSLLLSSTNVLPRGQKLIHKGKILVDPNTLRSSGITGGSKIMLMASEGLHQGDGPKINEGPALSNYQRIVNSGRKLTKPVEPAPVGVVKTRVRRWKITGVVALSESHLKAIPDEVWDCGSSVRVLDLGNNHICDVPIKISCLSSIRKLILNSNQISDDSISWQGLIELKSLTYLSLNENYLTCLPPYLGLLTSLEQLHIASNKLETLPIEISSLTRLEILKANNNRISTVPACIGDCSSLVEVDLSANLLTELLPETFGNLQNLKTLHLTNNGLKSLPSTIFRKCVQLSTLNLHETGVTIDSLRQAEGWEEFDNRRRLKYQKQLDFQASGAADFDEGADKQ